MAVKKNLLIVNDLLIGGGVERLMLDLISCWNQKYNITVMTFDFCENSKNILPQNVEYMSASLPWEWAQNIFQKLVTKICRKMHRIILYQKLKKKHFDILLCMKDGWIMKRSERLQFIPTRLAWVHTDYTSYYYTYGIFGGKQNELLCMKTFKDVICVSDTVRKNIQSVLGDPGNLVVKYNPIQVKEIQKKAEEPVVDIETKRSSGVTRFVTVGRLNYQKGYDLLLEACHMLEREGLKYEVWVIGGAESWSDEHYRLYRSKNRMKVENVHFLGERKNPYKYMKYADWFLSTSIFEGYSLVSQEAAVLDIPLMLTDCSGVRELLGNSEYGIVMGISVLDIYENMKRVIEHPELREFYRQKIMERKKVINFEDRVREIEVLLE